MLGVCLGMQGLVTAYGGTVDRVPSRRTARWPRSTHDGRGVFAGLPQGFAAVRYHSLAARRRARRAGGDRRPPARCGDGRAGTGRCRWRACSSTPSRSSPSTAPRWSPTSWQGRRERRPDAVAFFDEVAAAHPRCFWLDGGGAREWSGRRSIIGWLDEDDVSLTYDAGRREVTRHVGRARPTWSATTSFAVLEAELAAGRAVATSGSATSATPPAPTCPAAPGPPTARRDLDAGRARADVRARGGVGNCPDTARRLVDRARPITASTSDRARRRDVRRRVQPGPGAPARRQLLRGQPDPPARAWPASLTPAAAYLRLREPQPRAVRRVPPARPCPGARALAAELVAGALRAGHRRPDPRDQADQGHHRPRRRRPAEDEAAARASSRPTRSSAPRT